MSVSRQKQVEFDELQHDKLRARDVGQACLDGKLDRAEFVGCCMAIFSPYDSLSRSTFYGQIEAAMGQHFCEFWDECAESECTPSGWEDFAPLFLLRRSS